MIDPDHDIGHNVGSLLQGIGRFSPRMSVSSLRINLSVRPAGECWRVLRSPSQVFAHLERVYNPEKIFDFELLLCNPYVQQHGALFCEVLDLTGGKPERLNSSKRLTARISTEILA
jgi:hypothetical protein